MRGGVGFVGSGGGPIENRWQECGLKSGRRKKGRRLGKKSFVVERHTGGKLADAGVGVGSGTAPLEVGSRHPPQGERGSNEKAPGELGEGVGGFDYVSKAMQREAKGGF